MLLPGSIGPAIDVADHNSPRIFTMPSGFSRLVAVPVVPIMLGKPMMCPAFSALVPFLYVYTE
jgi:hypothetical protein